MQHKMNLHDRPFESIKLGAKTVEMRLFDDKRQMLKVGDTILFTNNSTAEQIVAEVQFLKTFPNFEQLYKNFDKVSIGYALDEVATADDMFNYYTAEQIETYGVVAIGIKIVKVAN